MTRELDELERRGGDDGNVGGGGNASGTPYHSATTTPTRADLQQRLARETNAAKRTAVLMRQIEREEKWSYEQLYQLRERVRIGFCAYSTCVC